VITAEQARSAKEALKGMWQATPAWMSGVGIGMDSQGSHVVKVLVNTREIRPSNHLGGDYAPSDPRTGDFRYARHDLILPSSVQGVPVVAQMTGPIVAFSTDSLEASSPNPQGIPMYHLSQSHAVGTGFGLDLPGETHLILPRTIEALSPIWLGRLGIVSVSDSYEPYPAVLVIVDGDPDLARRVLPTNVSGFPVIVQQGGPIAAQPSQATSGILQASRRIYGQSMTGFDWPWSNPVADAQAAAQQQAQDAINQAAQEAAYQEKIRQEQATAQLQQTIAQQASAQEAKLQPTASDVSAAAQQAQKTAQTWQTVGYVVAGMAVLGVGYYIWHSSK
jgi:hypothetical protein